MCSLVFKHRLLENIPCLDQTWFLGNCRNCQICRWLFHLSAHLQLMDFHWLPSDLRWHRGIMWDPRQRQSTAVVTQAKETQQKDKENNGKQKIGSYGVRASVDYVLMAKQRWQVMMAKTRIMIVLTDAESDFCFKSRVLCDIHISCTDSPHWTSGSPGVCMRMSRS